MAHPPMWNFWAFFGEFREILAIRIPKNCRKKSKNPTIQLSPLRPESAPAGSLFDFLGVFVAYDYRISPSKRPEIPESKFGSYPYTHRYFVRSTVSVGVNLRILFRRPPLAVIEEDSITAILPIRFVLEYYQLSRRFGVFCNLGYLLLPAHHCSSAMAARYHDGGVLVLVVARPYSFGS